MKFTTSAVLVLLLAFGQAVDTAAQESELGELPPMPNLNLGDPDTKRTWNQSRLRAQMAAQERKIQESEAKLRAAEEPDRPMLGERIASSLSKPQKTAVPQEITVQNSLPSGEDGITASGSRLRAFGDESYWGRMPEPTPDEALAELPPLPDLRSSDQVTKTERLRDSLVARQELRKAEADAAREQRELMQRVVVDRPAPDPSSALVHVQSQRETGAHSSRSPHDLQIGPASVNAAGQRLRPFGDAEYWGPREERVEWAEELLVDLPPMPDLRAPDQVTERERLRDSLVARQGMRNAEAEEGRERRELAQRTVVNPPTDTSTAPVQVHFRGDGTSFGAAPATVGDGRALTPFDGSATYVEGEWRKPGSLGSLLGALSLNPATQTLQSTGDTPFGGDQQPERLVASDEHLIDLPPMPDLRDPGQVTKKERLRDSLVAKQAARNAEAEEARERRELAQRTAVTWSADPSTAPVQVHSRGGGTFGAAPETVGDGRALRPFDGTATYVPGETRRTGSMGGMLGAMSLNPATRTLQPTGDTPFGGDQQPERLVASDEHLIDLPPMPDLRDPGQVTKKERLRDSLVAKQAARNAEAEEARERRELMQRNVVNRPPVDPSTALVQVQPQSSGAAYAGNQAAPEAVGEGRTLKPFNENSTYTQGNQILFKGPNANAPSGGGLFRRKSSNP